MPASRTTSGRYERVALAYEERIVPYYTDIAKALVAVARIGKGARILASTGIVARVAEPLLGPPAEGDRASPHHPSLPQRGRGVDCPVLPQGRGYIGKDSANVRD